ncbi:hypothetical protein Bca4012_059713 [Brassica carinata]
MKFGREYEAQMIQEWREAYMDYRSLKSIVKQILRYHLQKQQRPYHPPPLPTGETAPLHAASTAPTGASGLSRRVSLYRAFSGLTNRVKGGSPRKSHKHNNPLSSKRHYHLFDEDEEQAILINEDETGSYTTTFLCSSDEGGEMEVQFFRRLDEEFNKVLRFYKQKVESVMEEADELSRQLNVLIALRVKVENPNVDFPDINSISSAPSSPRATNRTTAISPMEVIKEMEQAEDKKVFKPASVEMLDHIKLKIEPETPLSMLKCMIMGLSTEQTFSKPELKRAEELMDRAFVEFYQKLRFLKGYSFLNQLAFSKILKKYDKTTSRNASKPYLHTVDHSYLGSCDEVSRLMSRVEATFIKHFANGNHRDGMKCLRPKAKREKHRITYFLGFLSGCAVALAIAITVLVHIRGITKSEGRHQYMENIFPLYSMFGFVAVHLFMFAGDIYFWSRYRVNYPFIFGFEQGNDLGYREVLLLGSGLAVLTFGGAISNLDMEMDPRTKSFSVITELVPLVIHDNAVLSTQYNISVKQILLHRMRLPLSFKPAIQGYSPGFFSRRSIDNTGTNIQKLIVLYIVKTKVVNVVLRLAWMQTVLGIREAPFLHRRALVAVVTILEIVRRGIWNFFRLENEHLNNVGKYRAFKSVPLPFQEVEGSKSM